MLLYHHPSSTCSQKVRLVLHHKKIPFEEHLIDLLAGDHLTPDYLALNPNGVVPTPVSYTHLTLPTIYSV